MQLTGVEKVENSVRTIAVDLKKPEIIYACMSAMGLYYTWRSTDWGKIKA
jgi:hypothetical protein